MKEPRTTSVTHFSTYEGGGAGRAAYRIHRSLVEHGPARGVSSRMRVVYGCSDDPTVTSGPASGENWLWRHLRPRLASRITRGFFDGNAALHSTCWPSSGIGRELSASNADIIHLHWIGRAGLSIEEVGRMQQPLVWTLHDQWAFCGAEHYVRLTPFDDIRFKEGYLPGNRPSHERGPDLNRRTWERKLRNWRKPIHIVCPSQWLAREARSSALMNSWPIRVIPYPIDLEIWAPLDQAQARAKLGLPLARPLVLFIAHTGALDLRKGADLLFSAVRQLSDLTSGTTLEGLELIVIGAETSQGDQSTPFKIHYREFAHNDAELRLYYAAADVVVIPSRQDNLPNAGLEAHACGTPVAGFSVGGLKDIVADRITGALAQPYDTGSLAAAIAWILEDPARRRSLGAAARKRAEELWHPKRIAEEYAAVYFDALSSRAA